MQYSTPVRNAKLDVVESTVGASAILKIRSGSMPVNCAAVDSGDILATVNLPADWMHAASGGSKSKSGTWEDTSADMTGAAGHFRIYDSGETACHIQGSCGTTGTDMILSSTTFVAGQAFTVVSFTITDNNG